MSPHLEGSPSSPDLSAHILAFAQQNNLILENGLVIALSGGADSSALLFACAELHVPLTAVYVDHRLRPVKELEAEWRLVQANAASAGVSVVRFALEIGEVDEHALRLGCGIEASARLLRYRILDRERSRHGYAYIALGHTADDVAETMCARFFQGSGLSGLHGIPSVRLPYVRPLIEVSRAEILSYLRLRGLEYSDDSSNAGADFQRNRIRKRILPVIAEEFPSYRKSLLESAAYFAEEEALLLALSRTRLPWNRKADYAEIDAGRFFSEPASLRIRSLLDLLGIYAVPASRIPRRFLAVAASPGNSQFRHGGHGFSLERRGSRLRFTPSVVFHDKRRYLRKVRPGEAGRIGPIEFILDRQTEQTDSACFRLVLPKEISEVYIRSRRSSDRIRLPQGTRSLKSIFNGQKIPEQLRDLIPVVLARQEIIAVAASVLGFRDVCTDPEGESIHTGSIVLQLRLVE